MGRFSRAFPTVVAATLGTVAVAAHAAATPTRLTRAEFDAVAAGMVPVVENFDRFEEGVYDTAASLANGVYSSAGPWVHRLDARNRALTDGVDTTSPRTFSAFPSGTRLWASDIAVEATAMLRVTVIGGTGVATFEVRGQDVEGFLAFTDPLSLVAVSVVPLADRKNADRPVANIGFDNVTTASAESPDATKGADDAPSTARATSAEGAGPSASVDTDAASASEASQLATRDAPEPDTDETDRAATVVAVIDDVRACLAPSDDTRCPPAGGTR